MSNLQAPRPSDNTSTDLLKSQMLEGWRSIKGVTPLSGYRYLAASQERSNRVIAVVDGVFNRAVLRELKDEAARAGVSSDKIEVYCEIATYTGAGISVTKFDEVGRSDLDRKMPSIDDLRTFVLEQIGNSEVFDACSTDEEKRQFVDDYIAEAEARERAWMPGDTVSYGRDSEKRFEAFAGLFRVSGFGLGRYYSRSGDIEWLDQDTAAGRARNEAVTLVPWNADDRNPPSAPDSRQSERSQVADAILVHEQGGAVVHSFLRSSEANKLLDAATANRSGGSVFIVEDGMGAETYYQVSPDLRSRVAEAKHKLSRDLHWQGVLDRHGVPDDRELRAKVVRSMREILGEEAVKAAMPSSNGLHAAPSLDA